MPFFHNIRTVAHYEAKTLRRSWFFRLFSLGALSIFTIFNISIYSPAGGGDWQASAIASALPHLNLYLLNIGQAIVVIFLAADFLKKDKKLDTNEVLYTRSMSNFEYIIGKTWGILRLFLGLNLIILAIGLVMNIIAREMTIDLMAYFTQLLIISIPTIVFSLGLAFVLMSLIRNQAITFLFLLGYAALNIFYLYFRIGGIFDYMAFGLPVFKSSIIGYGDLQYIVYQRLIYFLSGLALVLATVLLFKRLPQSKLYMKLTVLFLFIFLAGAGFSAYKVFSYYNNNAISKKRIIDVNSLYETSLFVTVTDADIEVVHNGESISVKASVVFRNDNNMPVDKYYFSLNPSLSIEKIISKRREISYSRNFHMIDIQSDKSLNPGEKDSLQIIYSGKILESFCYPDFKDNTIESPYRITLLNISKRQAFLTKDYVLLTPETHWYPVASLNYFPNYPARIKIDFANYTLKVKPLNGLYVISQGNYSKEGELSVYRPDSPLTGLTLIIGDYLSDKITVDSIDYVAYYFPGHDYYKKDFIEIKDTLPNLISGAMRDLENNISTDYPFSRLSLVEVPIQYFSYPRKNTQTRAEVQPSMILLPEKLATIDYADFYFNKKRTKKNMARNNEVITDKELEVRLFNTFVKNTFVSGENFVYTNGVAVNEPVRYLLGPSFYFFKNNFYSSEYPVVNAVFESYLQKIQTPGAEGSIQLTSGGLSINDAANLILKEKSFNSVLSGNPGFDTVRAVLGVKGEYLFNLMREKAGMSDFNEWFSSYIDIHKFISVSMNEFNTDINNRFGYDLSSYLVDWYNSKEQPGFLFTDFKVSEIVVDDRSRFQVTFVASNPESVPGIFNLSFRTASTGEQSSSGKEVTMNFSGNAPGVGSTQISVQASGMQTDNIDKIVYLEAKQAKKIGVILDVQPRAMLVNTLYSKNIPGEINFPFFEIGKAKKGTEQFEGETILAFIPPYLEANESVVDNEDQGFRASQLNTSSPLKKLLGIENTTGMAYEAIRYFRAPENWQPVALTSYYGKFVRSAVYTSSGTGDRSITWTTHINSPGYYEVYCYIPKTGNTIVVRRGQESEMMQDLHFKVYHDEGVEEITVEFANAEDGWNDLGSYYISPDSARVEMTNATTGRMVLGDAIKWIKQN
jgi:hypothetical protein